VSERSPRRACCVSYSQPGDPDNKGLELEEGQNPEDVLLYEDHCLEIQPPSLFFSGAVSAIPVPTGDPRIITLQISAYAGKESGANAFSEFSLHCVMSGAPRWGKTFLPRVGRWVTFAGDAVGTYTVNGVAQFV